MASVTVTAGQLWRRFSHIDRFTAATRAPGEAQLRKLLEITQRNKDTVFGREHDFSTLKTVADYQDRVPIQSYDDIAPLIERVKRGEKRILTADDPIMFAVTSGTTGKSKFIPVTPSYLDEYIHGMQIHNYFLLEDYPQVGDGHFMTPTSSDAEGVVESGLPYGAISGLVARRQPEVIRRYYALPYELSKVKDSEAKYYLGLRVALEKKITISLLPNPSSLIQLAEKLDQYRDDLIDDVQRGRITDRWPLAPDVRQALERRVTANARRADELRSIVSSSGALTPIEAWPDLAVLSCWKGGTMPMYLAKLPRYYGDTPIRDLGYMATEGRCATPIVNSGAAGVLNVTSHFYEFVPESEMDSSSPRAVTAEQLESNERYYLLLTTSAGLYRYNINDLVRVVDFYHNAPVIQFVRKGQGISSVTGEKLAESQVTIALMHALNQCGAEISHFTANVLWGDPPRYRFFVESSGSMADEQKRKFLHGLETGLCQENIEYEAKRESGRLAHPVIHFVAPGTYDKFRVMRASQGAAEAQIKIPTLSPDMKFGQDFEVIETFALE
ncbi:MAG: GH3 auxin-responsive promoter family protein [Chloroflexota bacterium]